MQLGLLDAMKDLLVVNPFFFDWRNCDLRCADYTFPEEQDNAENKNIGGIAGRIRML